MSKVKRGWNRFRPFQEGDLCHVWRSLRTEDRRELTTGGLADPELLEQMLKPSTARVTTWETEVGPVAVLGVTQTENPDAGLVWAVASRQAESRWRFAVRNTEGVLDDLGRGHKVLCNFKDSRNTRQINWLKKVGFIFIQTHAGEDGATYHEFVRIVK